MTVTHLWPSISPFNVWDLPMDVWVMYARAADDYAASQRE